MKRWLALIVVALFFWEEAVAGPVPDDIKKMVTFVLVDGAKGDLVPNGTAFFVGVKDRKNPDRGHVYLATARHVISKTPFGALHPHIYVRLSKRGGGTDIVKIPLISSGPQQSVFLHPDNSVDLAVIPGLPDESKVDFRFFPDDLLTTREKFSELGIREGSEVFFAGLFTHFLGDSANHPVFRFGRVALLTSEKIPWGKWKMDLYLLESSSYGGNSGSPVFFHLGSDRNPGMLVVGPPAIYLAGVMMGAYVDQQPIGVAETAPVAVSRANLGISAVIPAWRLHELLTSKAVADRRK